MYQEFKKHRLNFIKTESYRNDEAFLIAEEFVENLFCDMAKLCTIYCNEEFNIYDLPYIYSERQLDCVVMPVISSLCKGLALTEVPTERHCNNRNFQVDQANGRIDYWCIYKGYSFVIEMKHGRDNIQTDQTREARVKARWETMIKQLDSVKGEVKHYVDKTKGVIRLGLHFISSYCIEEPDSNLIKTFQNDWEKTLLRFANDLGGRKTSHRPDLVIGWRIPSKMVNSIDMTFPGFWVAAKIYDPIQHKGSKL